MYKVFKRLMDFIFALLLLVVASGPMIIIAISIKIDSKGPVFFKQERSGKNGKVFKLYKFRTMVANNDVRDLSCSDKITKVGKFLRRTSLDELGQLFNILKGQMSFIGPRAWIPEYFENMIEPYKHRYDVLPGITGLAQASGRNNLSITDKINYDLEYVNHISLKYDIKIIFLTIKTIFSDEGESAGKQVINDEIQILKDLKMHEVVSYDTTLNTTKSKRKKTKKHVVATNIVEPNS